jgi:tetratricopeptide (TPR) repeat protein
MFSATDKLEKAMNFFVKRQLKSLQVLVVLVVLQSLFVTTSNANDDIRPADRFETMPNYVLTHQIMNEILTAEIRSQRGEILQAAQTYLDLAKVIKDSRLARRATQLLLQGQHFERAFAASGVWINLAPQSPNAQSVFDGLAIASGGWEQLQPVILARLKAARAGTNNPLGADLVYAGLFRQLIQHPNRAVAYQFLEQLATKDANSVEGRIAKANWFVVQNDLGSATTEAALALAGSPQHAPSIWLNLQLAVNAKQIAPANSLLTRYIELPLATVRAEKSSPPLPHEELREALISALQPAKAQARFLVAVLYEQLKDNNSAIALLQQVTVDDDAFLTAQSRIAQILIREGKAEQALALANTWATVGTSSKAVAAVRAKAQILRDLKREDQVYNLLETALREQQEQGDLIYEFAMSAERLKKFDVMERELRKLIELQPENALPLNALGYSFADRNQNLAEAEALIRAALKIRPDDGMIVDSLGWVLFRRGQIQEAITVLRRAYSLLPDAEIGAHLGEALWVVGQREEAVKVWRTAAQKKPIHDVLIETTKRLGANVLFD